MISKNNLNDMDIIKFIAILLHINSVTDKIFKKIIF